MAIGVFRDDAPRIRMTPAAYMAIPIGAPPVISEEPPGRSWREIGVCGIRICVLICMAHDGPIIERYQPVIRVPAINRLIPRPGVMS